MKKVSSSNYSLHLQHNSIEEHNEYWLVRKNDFQVLSICPYNHPSISEHALSKLEALRQYALMTSPDEDWRVEDANEDWHQFLDDIET